MKCIKIYAERHVSLVRRKGLGYIATTEERGQHVKNVTELPSVFINDEGHNVKNAGDLPSVFINDKGHHVKNVEVVPSVFINEKGHNVKYARHRWLL